MSFHCGRFRLREFLYWKNNRLCQSLEDVDQSAIEIDARDIARGGQSLVCRWLAGLLPLRHRADHRESASRAPAAGGARKHAVRGARRDRPAAHPLSRLDVRYFVKTLMSFSKVVALVIPVSVKVSSGGIRFVAAGWRPHGKIAPRTSSSVLARRLGQSPSQIGSKRICARIPSTRNSARQVLGRPSEGIFGRWQRAKNSSPSGGDRSKIARRHRASFPQNAGATGRRRPPAPRRRDKGHTVRPARRRLDPRIPCPRIPCPQFPCPRIFSAGVSVMKICARPFWVLSPAAGMRCGSTAPGEKSGARTVRSTRSASVGSGFRR